MFTRATPAVPGIPQSVARDVRLFDYGNPRTLDVLKRQAHRLAAVVVEPVQSRCPEIQPAEFLKELRAITEKAGCLLIFDEMITGFRIHPGGAQAHFGVEADLATYAKIAGGGLPLSMVAGRHGLMDHIDGGAWSFGDASAPSAKTTFFAGTYCRHPLALAAARATALKLIEAGPALQDGLNATTSALVTRLNARMAAAGLPVEFTCFGSFFSIALTRSAIDARAVSLLSILLLTRGIHLRGGDRGGFLSTAHGAAEIDHIHDAFADGLETLAGLGLIRPTDRRTTR
ncbi:aminotransferase class III-fold pyridoxal phosphate-dependent enzyme [Methylobrevis pamukkalensis]|uniref:Glutamate-1-semialdehyde 2,1-aminomutase n=1 Tax=Methylobrevis pamukkalensis TaxID=1439726 RepID=A0A1E3H7P2_9HYPH|nr:aminotransferase class III-fold pyridoxal phosphate-dependent enzyme [Methylobrevis pamukkalensis]ODN72175.1 Glutamate-1-semialdehyde 2,1-aminomutase [Methylobrevis pamukkalensis]